MTDYYTRCKILWKEMSTLRPLPVCECQPQCSCELINKIRMEREEDCVIRFLKGLNEEFETLKSGVLVLEPIPPVYKVFGISLKLERQKNTMSIGHNNNESMSENVIQETNSQTVGEETMVASARLNAGNNFNNRRRFNGNTGNKLAKCTHCRMSRHTIDKCYKKHGYPAGWIPGYKSKNKQM